MSSGGQSKGVKPRFAERGRAYANSGWKRMARPNAGEEGSASGPAAAGEACTAIFIAMIGACLCAGFSMRVIGRLFVADLLLPLAFAVVVLWPSTRRYLQAHWREMVALLAFPVMGMLWDWAGETHPALAVRGFARNVVFASGAVAAMAVASRISCGRMLAIFAALAGSVPIAAYVQQREELTSLIVFIKYFGGWSVTLWLTMAIARIVSPAVAALALVPAGITMALWFSYRGFGAVLVLAGLFTMSAGWWKNIPRGVALGGIVTVPILIAVAALAVLQSDYISTALRSDWDYSNFQRLDMAVDAWRGFLEAPFVGNGSWAHAVHYTDISRPGMLLGVHSFVLQFAFEYGVTGLIFGGWLLWVAVGGAAAFLRAEGVAEARWRPVHLLVMMNLIYAVLMCPMGGYERVLAATGTGMALAQIQRQREGRRGCC